MKTERIEQRTFSNIPTGGRFRIPGESGMYMRIRSVEERFSLGLIPRNPLDRDRVVVLERGDSITQVGDTFSFFGILHDKLLDYILPEEEPVKQSVPASTADLDVADKLGHRACGCHLPYPASEVGR